MRSATTLVVATLVALTLATSVAHADEGRARVPLVPVVAPAPAGDNRVWYGARSLGLDVAAVALFATGLSSNDEAPSLSSGMIVVGLATYVIGAPVVHAAYGHGDRALKSLGLRLGAPLVAGVATAAAITTSCSGEDCGIITIGFGLIGAGAGALVAIIVDDFVLGRHTVPERPTRTWTPSVAPTAGGMTLGLAGTF